MKMCSIPVFLLTAASVCCVRAQSPADTKPPELEVLKASLGVWDADIEIWPQGPEAPSIKFKGVETIRAYGEYWIASDFDSQVMGETMKVHSIVGYDLDRKKLVGTVIDHGPYAAQMTGKYDRATKSVQWRTEAKTPDGKSMVQHTEVTHPSDRKRVLVLRVPGKEEGESVTFMQITFVKRD